MSEDFEYANGACGFCQECGEATEQEHHRLCRDCYAQEQGWSEPGGWRPDPAAVAWQRQDREQQTQLRTIELVRSLERRVEELHARVVVLEQRDRVAGPRVGRAA